MIWFIRELFWSPWASPLNFEIIGFSSRNHKLAHSKVELTVRRNDTSSCSEPPSLSAIPSARSHATSLLCLSHLYALVCVYAYASVRARVTRVFTRCPRHPYQCWGGRSCTVSHGRHVPVTTPGSLTSSRRRRRWWSRQWWCRTQLSWNTDNHPLLIGGHPNRSPTFLAHALDTFNQIPHARDSVNAKSPLLCDRITRFSRYVAVCFLVKYCWGIILFL